MVDPYRNRREDKRKAEEPGKAKNSLAGPQGRWSEGYRAPTSAAAPTGASWADRYNAAPNAAWLGGQNTEGEGNGWDTDFYEQFTSGYSEAQGRGEGADYFASKRTGVALWDDPDGRFKFGDTFINGRDEGNVYEKFGQAQGDLLMGRLVLGTELGRHKTPEALAERLRDFRVSALHDAQDAATFSDYEKLVGQKAKDISDWEIQLAGAGMGALTWGGVGALAGAVGTPVAMAIGGGIGVIGGGIAGFVGADANKDAIRRQIAESRVQADLGAQRLGDSTGQEWLAQGNHWLQDSLATVSATGGTVSNLVSGIREMNAGGVGDGKRQESDWGSSLLGLGAGFVDAFARSANVPARLLFQGEMLGTGYSQAAQLALTGGQAFDYRSGTFRNVFTDRDSGEVDAGTIGRGLLYATSPLVDVAQGHFLGGLNKAMRSGATSYADDARKLGSEGGFTWTRGADGQISKRLSTSFFAPSEAFKGATAAARARFKLQSQAGARGIADSTALRAAERADFDKLMYAELRRQSGPGGLGVNAIGEGFEEAYQSIAEQVGMGHTVDWNAVRESFAAGTAMGAGMHLGVGAQNRRAASADVRLTRIAGDNYQAVMRTKMPETVTQETLRLFAAMSPEQIENATKQAARMQESIGTAAPEVVQELVIAAIDAEARLAEARSKTNQEKVDSTGMITRLDETVNAHNAEGSTETVLEDYLNHSKGLKGQAAAYQRRFEAGQLTIQQRDELVRRVNEAATRVDRHIIPLLLAAEAARQMYERNVGKPGQAAAEQQLRKAVVQANKRIGALWNAPRLAVDGGRAIGRGDMVAVLASSLIFHRAPKDQRGSMQAMKGLVSVEMSTANDGKGSGRMRRVGVPILQQVAGDYDGDLFKTSNSLIADFDQIRAMRSGPGRWQGTPAKPVLNITSTTEDKAREVGRVMADPGTWPGTSTAIARRISSLDAELKSLLGGIADEAVSKFTIDLGQRPAGDSTLVKDFFDALGPFSTEIAERSAARWTDLVGDLEVAIERALADTSRQYHSARYLLKKGQSAPTAGVNPFLAGVEDVAMDSRVEQTRAATDTLTRSAIAWVADVYRDSTGTQYSRISAPVWEGREAFETLDAYADLVAAVRASQSGEFADASEGTQAGDRIISGTRNAILKAVQKYGDGGAVTENELLAAAARIGDYDVSLVELEFRGRVAAEVRELMAVRGDMSDPAISALIRLAGKSRSEILAMVYADSIGLLLSREDAAVFDRPNMTINQVAKWLVNTSPQKRNMRVKAMERHRNWANDVQSHTQHPRTLEQSNGLTAYQVVAEAAIDIANHIPKNVRRSSDNTQAAAVKAVEALRDLLVRSNGTAGMPTTTTQLQELLAQRGGILENYLRGMLSDTEIARLIVHQPDGRPQFADWILKALLAPSAEKTVDMIWIHSLLTEVAAVDASRSVDDIQDLRVRAILTMMNTPGTQPWLLHLGVLVKTGTSQQILDYLNDHFRSDGPEFTLWSNDVRSYDEDATKGGWLTPESTADRVDYLRKLEQLARTASTDVAMAQLKSVEEAEAKVLQAMERGDAATVSRYEELLAFNERYGSGLSWSALVNVHLESLWGLPAGMSAKGANIASTEIIGRLAAMQQGIDYGDTVELGIWQSFAGYLGAISNNPELLGRKASGTFFDSEGNQVEWKRPDAAEFAALWRGNGLSAASKEQVRALLRATLFPVSYAESSYGTPQPGYDSLSLSEVMGERYLSNRMFGNAGMPTTRDSLPSVGNAQAAAFASALNNGTDNKFHHLIQALLVAQTSADEFAVESEDVRAGRVALTARRVAQFYQAITMLPDTVLDEDGNRVDSIQYLRDLAEERRNAYHREHNEFGEGGKAEVEGRLNTMRDEALTELGTANRYYMTSPSRQNKARLDAAVAYAKRLQSLVDDYKSPSVRAQVEARYGIVGKVDDAARQRMWDLWRDLPMIQYGLTDGERMELENLSRPNGDGALGMSAGLAETISNNAKAWAYERLGAGGILPGSHRVDPSHPVQGLLLDPSFGYLDDMLYDPEMIRVARQLRADFHREAAGRAPLVVEQVDAAARRLTGRENFGDWTIDIARITQQNMGWINASADPVSRSGSVVHRASPLAAATRFLYDLIPSGPGNYVTHDIDISDPKAVEAAELQGRFVQSAEIVDIAVTGETSLGNVSLAGIGTQPLHDTEVVDPNLWAMDANRYTALIKRHIASGPAALPPGARRVMRVTYIPRTASTGDPSRDERNMFIRGVNTTLDQIHASNNIGLFLMGVGGPGQAGTTAAFKTAKTGQMAIRHLYGDGAAEEARLRALHSPELGGANMTAYLDALTDYLLHRSYGDAQLSIEWWTGLREYIGMHIAMRYLDDEGNPMLVSGGYVERHALTGTLHEVLRLPAEIVRTLLGAPAPLGGMFPSPVQSYDLTGLRPFNGIYLTPMDAEMNQALPGLLKTEGAGWRPASDMFATRPVDGQQGVQVLLNPVGLDARYPLSNATSANTPTAASRRTRFTETQAEEMLAEHTARADAVRADESAGRSTNRYAEAYEAELRAARVELFSELEIADEINAMSLLMREMPDVFAATAIATTYNTQEARQQNTTAFRVEFTQRDDLPQTSWSIISSLRDLENQRKGEKAVAGDLVTVVLDTAVDENGQPEAGKLHDMLAALVARGLNIELAAGKNSGRARELAERTLRSQEYTEVGRGLWIPRDAQASSANVRSRMSVMKSMGYESASNKLLVFYNSHFHADENSARLLLEDGVGLPPITGYTEIVGGETREFVFVGEEVSNAVAAEEKARIAALTDAELHAEVNTLLAHQRTIYAQANDPAWGKAEHDELFKAMRNYGAQWNVAFPDDQPRGSLIPLVDSSTNRILFVRTGMRPPRADELRKMFDDPKNNRVMYFPPVLDQTITSRDLTHVKHFRGIDGRMRVRGSIEVSDTGKFTFEGTGHKLTLSPARKGTRFADFIPGLPVRVDAGLPDAFKKGGIKDTLDNAQNLIKILGYDQVTFLTSLAYGVEPRVAASKAYKVQRDEVATALRRTYEAAQDSRLPDEAVDQSIRSLSRLAQYDIDVSTAVSEVAEMPIETDESKLLLASLYSYWRMSGASYTGVLHSNPIGRPTELAGGAGLWRMPGIWTQFFDNLPYDSPLRLKFADYMNGTLLDNGLPPGITPPVDAAGLPVTSFTARINPETFWFDIDVVEVDDFGKQSVVTISGIPALADLESTGDDTVISMAADERKLKQGISVQGQAFAASIWNSAEVVRELRDKAGTERVQTMFTGLDRNKDVVGEVFARFDALTSVTGLGHSRVRTAAELKAYEAEDHLQEAFRDPLNLLKLKDDSHLAEINTRYEALARTLGLEGRERRVIDQLVRLATYSPGPLYYKGQSDQDENAGVIAGKTILSALVAIQRNVEAGNLPLTGQVIPRMPYDALLTLHRAATGLRDQNWLRWNGGTEPVTDLNDWVELSLGQLQNQGQVYNKAFLPAIDGATHTYLAHEGIEDMLGSVDAQRGEQLLGIGLEQLMVSWDPARASELTFMPVSGTQSTVGDILMATHNGSQWVSNLPEQTLVDQVLHDLWAWQESGGIPVTPTSTTPDVKERGRAAVRESRHDRDLYTGLKDWRIALALLNPGMMIASPAEFAQIRAINNTASIINGTSTSAIAEFLAWLRETLGGSTDAAGILSSTDIRLTRQALAGLGQDRGGAHWSLFADEFKDDTAIRPMDMFHKAARGAARKGTRLQDPLLNRSYETYQALYLEGLFSELGRSDANNISMPELVQQFKIDPTFWRRTKGMERAHEMAMNRVRSAKLANQTVWNKIFQYHLTRLEDSQRLAIRWPARMTVGLASVFSKYAFARAEQIVGGQVIGQMIALHMAGRRVGGLARAYDNAFSWLTKPETKGLKNAPLDTHWEMDDILESLDLGEAFLRSGTTWATYFLATAVLDLANLTGEDDEDRRRRRQGKAAGNVHLYDPRDVANDFRNLDAIYLDSIPWLGDLYRTFASSTGQPGRSPVQMNWIMRSLFSPVLGMYRFQTNGNPYEMLWGFQDALRSMPLINTMNIWDTSEVYGELVESHREGAAGEGAMDASTNLAVRLAMNLERMLLESSFVNELYKSSDKYDRDPYKIANRDAQGNILHDRVGGVEGTKAMQDYVDENGVLRKAYLTRDDPWLNYAENRATWATILLPFTWGESWRTNMVTKTRSIDKSTTIDDARQVVMDLFNKDYVSYDQSAAVLWGMWKGSVKVDSPALDGFYMSYETRLKLTDEFQDYLIQDGLSLGLNKKQAIERANKLWWGDKQQPNAFTPFNQLVWSDQISYDPSTEYRQLNTTYVMGPDGRPWATGISRDVASSMANMAGILPWQGYNSGSFGGMNTDALFNSVDPIAEINTGMRSLERIDESWSFSEPLQQLGTGGQPYYPYSGYRRSGYGGFGGGGGGGGGGYAPRGTFGWIDNWYEPKAYLPKETRAYKAPTPSVFSNTNIQAQNPQVRRLSRRRERVQSQRGRLKPWQ